jgi:hypothetical protein
MQQTLDTPNRFPFADLLSRDVKNLENNVQRPYGPEPNFSPARKGWEFYENMTERRRCGRFQTDRRFVRAGER